MTDTNITDHEAMKALIERQYSDATKQMNTLAESLYLSDVEAWESRGGCKNCEGTCRVLTWSTLDGPSWDEFGPCPACTDDSRKIGLKPGVYSARGSGGRHCQSWLEYAKTYFPLAMTNVIEAYDIAKANYDRYIANQLTRGDYVIVLKGRKVPVGTHGVVVGVNHGTWGTKVGIIDNQGKIEWTAATNVERCLGMDGSTKRPAFEAFIKSNEDYAKSKGYKTTKKYDIEAMITM